MASAKRTPSLIGRSPLRATVLAVLLEGPGYGYEIAIRLRRWVGPSWRIHAKHLYPLLESLEKDGLVSSEEIPSDDSRKDQKVYYPTPEAEQARAAWMQAPAILSLVRADIQARLIFSHAEEAPSLLKMLDEYEQDVIAALEDNAAVDVPPVSWRGMMVSHARSLVTRRLDAERASISEARRDIEEFVAKS
jgi:DNA-binding PadR family transcriptional regulator